MGRFIRIGISAAGCIALALMLLVLPLRWILAWAVAAAFHECCHALAVKLCGGRVDSVTLNSTGAEMEVSDIQGGRELLCALAGPLGSLMLLFFARWIPAVAVCAVFQTAYNLLPLYPMDGGRALRCAAQLIAPQLADKLVVWVGRFTLILIWVGGAYGAIGLKLGIMPLLMALILCLKTGNAEKSLALLPNCEYNDGRFQQKRYGYDRITTADPAHGSKARPVHRRRIS